MVAVLAAAGVDEEAASAADDKSSRVRRAVADVLDVRLATPIRSSRNRLLCKSFLHDTSADVQVRAVESLEDWPLEIAGPVLLAALEQPTFMTRQAAARQLGHRWPPAANFPVDGAAEKGQLALEELRTKWIAQFGSLQDQVASAAKNEFEQRLNVSPEKLAEVAQLLAPLIIAARAGKRGNRH